MYRLTFDDLKSIDQDDYKNYRVIFKNSGNTFSFREFMCDLSALFDNRYPVNHILQKFKKEAGPSAEIIIQKMVLRSASELGLGDFKNFCFQDFDDYAVFVFNDEMELLNNTIQKFEKTLNRAIKNYGQNDPVY